MEVVDPESGTAMKQSRAPTLYRNTLVHWLPDVAGTQPKLDRLLYVWPPAEGGTVALIDIFDRLAWPRVDMNVVDLQEAVGRLDARIEEQDPYAASLNPPTVFQAKHIAARDAAMARLSFILSAGTAVFDPVERGRLVTEAVTASGVQRKYILRDLRRYFQRGMVPNALLPDYKRCGGPGKAREPLPGRAKRGRPRGSRTGTRKDPVQLALQRSAQTALPKGMNLDSTSREKLTQGYRVFRVGKRSVKEAYDLTIEAYWSYSELNPRTGVTERRPLPEDQRPSVMQFRYYGEQDRQRDVTSALIREVGERRYLLRHRPLAGYANDQVTGPGDLWAIDSTRVNAYVRSSIVPWWRLPRPWLYIVQDAWSYMITGFCVTLVPPSWAAAALALDNCIAEKSQLFEELGLPPIGSDEWPAAGVFPWALKADRGELRGHNANSIVRGLGCDIAITAPYRADWKGDLGLLGSPLP